MTTKSTKRLCDEDCNNCNAIENHQVSLLLNVLALQFGDKVWHITNHICPNMTCCPICKIDDFCHDVSDDFGNSGIAAINEIRNSHSCEVAEMAKKIFKEFDKEKKQCESKG